MYEKRKIQFLKTVLITIHNYFLSNTNKAYPIDNSNGANLEPFPLEILTLFFKYTVGFIPNKNIALFELTFPVLDML